MMENLIEHMPTLGDVAELVDAPEKTILIVDDDQDLREGLRIRFEKSGYRVLTASNGETAIKTAQMFVPDLIIMDLYMPKMDGHEATQKIRCMYETHYIPVIVLTASRLPSDHHVAKYIDEADHVMTKPFDSKILSLLVQKILNS